MFWGSGLDGSRGLRVPGRKKKHILIHFEHSRETLFIDSRITVRRFRWSGPFRKREVYSLDLLDITAVSMLWVDWSTKDCLIVAHQNFEVDFGKLLRSLSLQLQCIVGFVWFCLFFGGCWRLFLQLVSIRTDNWSCSFSRPLRPGSPAFVDRNGPIGILGLAHTMAASSWL